jgi:hypothetical protein
MPCHPRRMVAAVTWCILVADDATIHHWPADVMHPGVWFTSISLPDKDYEMCIRAPLKHTPISHDHVDLTNWVRCLSGRHSVRQPHIRISCLTGAVVQTDSAAAADTLRV